MKCLCKSLLNNRASPPTLAASPLRCSGERNATSAMEATSIWTVRYGGGCWEDYREPRPHARSAETRQEKTRGRRRIGRKAPDLWHDAVTAGAMKRRRLHTGTTTRKGHISPQWVRGDFGLSLRLTTRNSGKANCLLSLPFCLLALGICLFPSSLPRTRVQGGNRPLAEWGGGKDEKGERNLKRRFQFFLRFCEV